MPLTRRPYRWHVGHRRLRRLDKRDTRFANPYGQVDGQRETGLPRGAGEQVMEAQMRNIHR